METIEAQTLAAPAPQTKLGEKGFIVYIAFLSAFIPLSTDIYLPALPSMVENLNTTPALVNLTIVFFFVFFALGTLFWGPLSDKYGRKPVLLAGLLLYTLASFLCVFSTSIYALIIFRVLQAIGCGSATAISNAIIKDSFEGERRGKILAIVQSMALTSPIVAPVIGAFILNAMSWRGVFIVLTVIGVISVAGTFLMDETLTKKSTGNILATIKKLRGAVQNKSLMYLLFTFAFMQIAFMSYITGSSYIYVDGFGVSEQMYSFYFSANAVFLLLGPLLYIQAAKRFNYRSIIKFSFLVVAVCGLMILLFGNTGPLVFCLILIPASLFGNMLGPIRMNLMIEQVDDDMGAASSIIMCTFTLIGSIGMLLISIDFINKVTLMGSLYLAMSLICLAAWLKVSRLPIIRHLDYAKK
ncbi:MAG: multidrug effflux MFS transporter [Anaerolineaceae bacterium]|nr:multidrug effflux MFS transporter [Anaerolineaceae bacterium]